MNGLAPDDEHAATRALLLAELETFEESIWRSEETGEKRFDFFITLVTAVAGGLGAVWTLKPTDTRLTMSPGELTCYASFGLLIFGLLSFLRMRQRDSVTAGYKQVTAYIRTFYCRLYSESPPSLQDYRPPLKSLGHHQQTPLAAASQQKKDPFLARVKKYTASIKRYLCNRADKALRGGYTVSVAVMNGLLLAVALMAMDCDGEYWNAVAIAAGALLTLGLCLIRDKPVNAPEKA